MAYGIAIFPATIARVSFHGIDNPAIHLFHNAYMVRSSVLAFVLIISIEKDQVAGARLIAAVPPQFSLPEPLEADGAACEPWDDAGVQIAALVGAPINKSRLTNPPGSLSHTRTNRADRLHCRAGREPPLRSPHHLCQCRIVVNS